MIESAGLRMIACGTIRVSQTCVVFVAASVFVISRPRIAFAFTVAGAYIRVALQSCAETGRKSGSGNIDKVCWRRVLYVNDMVAYDEKRIHKRKEPVARRMYTGEGSEKA